MPCGTQIRRSSGLAAGTASVPDRTPKRIKAEGAITWLMPGRGESGDYLRCSEHKRHSGATEDCGRTVAG
jgi:hypothetical protein